MTRENLSSGVWSRLRARRGAATAKPETARCVKDSIKALKGVVGLVTPEDLRDALGNANIRIATSTDFLNASVGCVACGAECTVVQRPDDELGVNSPPAVAPHLPSFSDSCLDR